MFRRVVPEDLPWMLDIAGSLPDFFFEQRLRRAAHDPDARLYAAMHNGRGAAFAAVEFPAPGHAWLQWMRVSPESQNAGLGTAFTGFLIEESQRLGARYVGLTTMDENVRVHRIMDRMGFSHVLTEWSSEDPVHVLSENREGIRPVSPGEIATLISSAGVFTGERIIRHPEYEECFTDWRLLPWDRLARDGRIFGVCRDGRVDGAALIYGYYRKRWTTFVAPLFGESLSSRELLAFGASAHRLLGFKRLTLALGPGDEEACSPVESGLTHGVRVYCKIF